MPDGSAFHVEFQTPWKRCRSAIQFLVEPVAQTPNSLRYQQARSDGVSQQGHWIVLMTAPCPCGQRSEQHAAPDAKSAIPNAEHFRPVAIRSEETFRRGDDVISRAPIMPAGTLTRVISSTWSKIATQLFSNVWWLSILQGRFPSKCTTHRYESLLDRWKTAKSLAMECMQVSWFPDGSPRIRYGAWTTEIVRMVYFATRAYGRRPQALRLWRPTP